MTHQSDREWIDRLIEPAEMSVNAAIEQGRILEQSRPGFVKLLIRRLANETALGAIDRLLDLIGSLAPPEQIEQLFPPFLQSEQPRIQSKAAKIYAYRMGDPRWAMQFLNHPDARLTANVIEALWHAPRTEHLSDFFWAATKSQNGRVLGNAAVGLCLLDDPRASEVLHRMCTSESGDVRAAGAWVLGVTGRHGNMHLASLLLWDNEPKVHRNAARAIRRLRARGVTETAAAPAVLAY